MKDSDLDVHGLYSGPVSIIQWEDIPTQRLHKLNYFRFLKFMETICDSNRNLLGSVTLIRFEIQVEGQLPDPCLFQKLNVDQVRLLPI